MDVLSNFLGRRKTESLGEVTGQYLDGQSFEECVVHAAMQGMFSKCPLAVILTDQVVGEGTQKASKCAAAFYQNGLLRTEKCSEHWLLQFLSGGRDEETIAAELCRENLKQEKLVVLKDFHQFFYWEAKAIRILHYLTKYLYENNAVLPVVIPMTQACYESLREHLGKIQDHMLVFGLEDQRELPWYKKWPQLLEKEKRRGAQYFEDADYDFGYLDSTGQPRWLVSFDIGGDCHSVILLYSKDYPNADRNVFLIPIKPSADELNRRYPGQFRFINIPETGKNCIDINPKRIPEGISGMEAVFRCYYKKLLRLERGF